MLALWQQSPDAEDAARAALRHADDLDFPLWRAWAIIHLGWALSRAGDQAGLDLMLRGISDASRAGAGMFTSFHLGLLALAQMQVGRIERARASLKDAFIAHEAHQDFVLASPLWRFRGNVLFKAESDTQEEGVDALRRAVSIARDQASPTLLALADRDLKRVLSRFDGAADAMPLPSTFQSPEIN
jgi:hypothetical protein